MKAMLKIESGFRDVKYEDEMVEVVGFTYGQYESPTSWEKQGPGHCAIVIRNGKFVAVPLSNLYLK